MPDPNTRIRPCRPEDAATLVALIRELAVYERLEHQVKATPEGLAEHLFGERRYAEAVLAEIEGEAVGFALYFFTYSTFVAKPSLYLEDLFVRTEHRGAGLGKALLTTLARVAVERGCGRMEWSVLDWNEPALGFYRALDARPMDEWTVYRLDGEALARVAATAPPLPIPETFDA